MKLVGSVLTVFLTFTMLPESATRQRRQVARLRLFH
jgi:hypothetical protein